MTEQAKQGWYLYSLAQTDKLTSINGKGLDNKTGLFLETFGKITAVLSKIDLDEFTGSQAEDNLNDLNWVGPRAMRHEQIVETIMETSSILPTRFGTIFTSTDSLYGFVHRNQDLIADFLSDVQNKQEWSVKGYFDQKTALERLGEHALAEAQSELKSLSPGLRYFQEKKVKFDIEKDLNRHLDQLLENTHQELAKHTVAYHELKLLSKEASGQELDMIFNWAFLIEQDRLDDLENTSNRLNQDSQNGLTVTISGPFPPYSFCPALKANS